MCARFALTNNNNNNNKRMEGGDLLDRVTGNPLTEDDARTVMRGILSGLKYLHANNIVHRDLKPENIMMAGKGSLDVKITDFGLSRVVDEKGLMSTLCGTPQYMAPEILMKQKYSSKADIWSIGIILYVILSSRLPFSGSTINAIFKRIHAGHLDFSSPPWLRVSALAKEVIRFILVTNPEKRPSVDEVLAHKWFSVDSKKVDVKKEGDGSGNADDDKESSTAEEAEKDIQQQQQQPPAKRKHVECKSAAF